MIGSQPSERRPIASREWPIFKTVARCLAAWGVSPNAISTFGMLAAVAAGLCFGLTAVTPPMARAAWICGAALVQLRLLANMFDGMVAIQTQRASPIGELFNEVPDRVSDAAILIGLGYSAGGHVILGYAAAAVAIFTAYVRVTGKIVGGRQEFCGPLAKPQRMFVVSVIAAFCALSPLAWQTGWKPPQAGLGLVIAGGLITAARRLIRVGRTLKSKGTPG